MIESEFKKLFKDSVKHHGGIAISLNSAFHTGLPDLYVILPDFEPMLIEAKFLKNVGEKFSRQINYTPTQKNLLDKLTKVRKNSAFGLVGYKKDKYTVTACIVPTYVEILTNNSQFAGISDRKRGEFFDIPAMLRYVINEVPKIEAQNSVLEDMFDLVESAK